MPRLSDAVALRLGATDALRAYLGDVLAWRKTTVMPTIKSITNVNTGSSISTTLSIPVPLGTVAGDLLVFILGTRGTVSHTIAPMDLTQLLTQSRNSAGNLRILYKIATGNETGWTATWANGNTQTAMVLRIAGHSQTSPINVSAGSNNTSTTTTNQSAPAVTTTSEPTLIIRVLLMAIGSTAVTMSWSSPAAEVAYSATSITSGSGNGSLSVAIEGPAPLGVIPVRQVQSSAPQASAGATIAITAA